MHIVAVRDPVPLGFIRQAMIGIQAGGVCDDEGRLLSAARYGVRCASDVRTTGTSVHLEPAEQTYTWGTR